MVKQPRAGSRSRAAASEQLPTFEQYLRQTLKTLFSSLMSENFALASSTLAELADNLNYVDMFDLIVQMDGRIEPYAEKIRSTDPSAWGWYLNSLGIALSRVGRSKDAVAKTDEMLAVGESLGDEDMQSTAIQNLGVISHEAGKDDDARRFYFRAMEIKERINDRRGQAQILNNLASMAVDDGLLDEAESLLARSIEMKKRSRNKEDMLAAYATSGNLAVARADFREARKHFRRVLRIAESIGSAEDVALACLNLGNVTMELGSGEEALSHYLTGLGITQNRHFLPAEELLRQALAVAYNKLGLYAEAQEAFDRLAEAKRRLGKTFDEAMAYHDAAVVSAYSDEPETALNYYFKAVRGFRRACNPEWEARSSWEMASSLVHANRTEEASRSIRRALCVLHRAGCADVLPEAYSAGVHILFQAGFVERAVTLFKEELTFLEQHSDTAYYVSRLAEVGNRLLDFDRPRRAKHFLQRAVSEYSSIPDPTLEALIRNDLAKAYADLGHLDQAKREYARILTQSEQEDNRVLRLLALMNLAEVERRSGDAQTAIDFGLQSIDLAEQVNDTDSLAMILNNLGLAYEDVGETRKARSSFRRSLRCAEQHQDNQAKARALISIGNIDLVKGRYEQALCFYQQAKDAIEGVIGTLSVDALASCLVCLLALKRGEEATIAADRAIEMADRIGDFDGAEDIARRVALASLEEGELEDCAQALLTSLSYASKKSMKSAVRNIVTWALLLRDAEERSFGRDALYTAITETIERVAPDHASAICEMLDVAINTLDKQ